MLGTVSEGVKDLYHSAEYGARVTSCLWGHYGQAVRNTFFVLFMIEYTKEV